VNASILDTAIAYLTANPIIAGVGLLAVLGVVVLLFLGGGGSKKKKKKANKLHKR
jgi:hypothetical protein